MEAKIVGQVEYQRISRSKPLRRFVQRSIEGWIRRAGLTAKAAHIRYEALLDRAGEGHAVACTIVIRAGDKIWRSWNYADGLHTALIRCLESLAPGAPVSAGLSKAHPSPSNGVSSAGFTLPATTPLPSAAPA